MDWMQILRMMSVLNAQQPQQGQGEPNLGSNMPGWPIVLNAGNTEQAANPVSMMGQGPSIAPPTPAPTPMGPDPGGEVGPPATYPPAIEDMQEPQGPPGLPDTTPEVDPYQRIMELYNNQSSPANEALMEMYRNYPQRNQPGIGRTILAAVSALSNQPGAVERTLYAPYYRELEDYLTRMKPLEVAARGEDRAADNARMMMLGMMQRETAARRAQTYEDINAAREREIDAKIDKIYGDLQRKEKESQLKDWIAKHPDHKFFWDEKGNLHAVDPKTNAHDQISGIEGLSEEDKQRFIQNRQIAVEKERAGGAMERTQTREWELGTVTDKQGKTRSVWYNPSTQQIKELKPGELGPGETLEPPSRAGAGGAKGRPMSWTQQLARIKANYVKIISDNPDFQKKFKADPITGLPILRKGHGFGESDKAWLSRRLFNDVFDETGTPVPPNLVEEGKDIGLPGGAAATAPPKTAAPTGRQGVPPKPGQLRVINPEGKEGWIPPEQWPAAEKQGYKKAPLKPGDFR